MIGPAPVEVRLRRLGVRGEPVHGLEGALRVEHRDGDAAIRQFDRRLEDLR